jgi:hypothetical protein
MSTSTPSLERAADFIWANARAVERALFVHRFLDGPADAVHAALGAYRNPDGGFGQGLESDARAPDSMPLHCDVALATLNAAGLRDPDWATGVADFLDSIAEPGGRVPIVTAAVTRYPHASHWSQPVFGGDSPNPTASLAASLIDQDISHPWLERATTWCQTRLEQPLTEAHEFICAFAFMEQVPDRQWAEKVTAGLVPQLDTAEWYRPDPGETRYGVTPLHLCPRSDSIARPHFDDAFLQTHLDALAAKQQDDGGWPINFEPPSPGAAVEWRGRWTLEALETLRAWARL